MIDYKQILTNVIISNNLPIIHGKTIIVIWHDRKHLEEWGLLKKVDSDPIRIVTLPSEQIDMFGVQNIEDVCTIALAFGIKDDYSDTNCIYHMQVRNKEE